MKNSDKIEGIGFSPNGTQPVDYMTGIIWPEDVQAKQQAEATAKALLDQEASDEGNAQCTALLYPGRFLYNEAFGWLYFDGQKWSSEGAETALEKVIKETIQQRRLAAVQSNEMERHEKLIKFCTRNRTRVDGAKYMLRSNVWCSSNSFDMEPDLLNCPNGVVNLRTGELQPQDASHRFFHCTHVAYAPDADFSVWEGWLRAAVGGDQATVDWLQMAVGYSLTGHTNEEILFYLYGPSRAGKGLFTETLLTLLGSPLAKEVNFATFTATRTGDTQNFDLAPLKPCRLVAASESNAYERFNEAKVKALTGGNEVYCAFKHREHFNYRPQYKIWLSSNQPVNADPDDDAVWGRIRLIEFPNSYLGREDKSLKRRMKKAVVLEGVLAWAIEGAIKWYQLGSAGLSELASSAELKDRQRGELDNVQAWLEEECEQDAASFTPNSELYPSYRLWCECNGVTPKHQKAFSQTLEHKGYQRTQRRVDNKSPRGFAGLQVKKLSVNT